jgi:hypothetical protein
VPQTLIYIPATPTVTNRNILHPRMASSGMLRRVALVRTDVSEELSVPFSVCWLLVTATFLVHRFLSPWRRRSLVTPKGWFLQEPHGVTSQKTPFFAVTAVKTSNLTFYLPLPCSFVTEPEITQNYRLEYLKSWEALRVSFVPVRKSQDRTSMIPSLQIFSCSPFTNHLANQR